MKKILKYLCYCLPMLALAVGCNDESVSEFQPDTNKSGEVTLLAAIENVQTRASLVATGEARWLAEDKISVVCSDGSIATFNLDGTGETRRALFKGTVEGKTLGEYAIYPTSATYSDGTLGMSLPAEVSPSATGSCSLMAATITENNEITFKQMLSYVALQLSNIHENTAKIVISSNNNLSGAVSAKLPEAFESGVVAVSGDATVTIPMPSKVPSMVNAFLAIPVGDYSSLVATAYKTDGKSIGEVSLIASPVKAERGLLLTYNAAMPDYIEYEKPAPIEGTVNVAGVYWALGNLEYEKGGESGNGFVTGWRIAPSQAHYFDAALGKTRQYENYDKRDIFNLGGIENPFDCDPSAAVLAAPGTNFSGKMFTDQACTTATTDFAAAKFGDVVYWASNGQYRMPSCEDLQQLVDKASAKMASYTLDGVDIKGVYFFDPEPGEDPVVNLDETVALTDEDLKVGLFFPYSGRGYNKSSVNADTGRDNRHDVFNSGSNCIYHVAEIKEVDPSTKNYVEGGCYGYTFSAAKAGDAETNGGLNYLNGAMNSTARLAIRPVYVGGGSGVNPNPTPDPTPDPVTGDWGENTAGGGIEENPYNGEL